MNASGGNVLAAPYASMAPHASQSSPRGTAFAGAQTSAGADAYDAVVQAANPSHPDHAVWQERFGGSLRSVRKSIDGPESSFLESPNGTIARRRSRSRAQVKMAGAEGTRPRPSLDSAFVRPKASPQDQSTSDKGKGRGTNEDTSVQHPSAPRKGSHDNLNGAGDVHHISEASTSKTTSSGRRKKRHRDKGKSKAIPPPVPPPRTTSHAAFHDQIVNSPIVPQESTFASIEMSPLESTFDRSQIQTIPSHQVSRSTSASTPSTPATPLAENQGPLSIASSMQFSASTQSANTQLSNIRGHGTFPLIHQAIPEGKRGDPAAFASLSSHAYPDGRKASNTDLPLRQSSFPSELTGTESSVRPSPIRTMFAPPSLVLGGRRSIDFRLPDEELSKVRQEARHQQYQRKGFESILAPFRNAVSSRRTEKQTSATSQDSPQPPTPILRFPPSRPSMSESPRPAIPTPPPRSPLRKQHLATLMDNDSSRSPMQHEIGEAIHVEADPFRFIDPQVDQQADYRAISGAVAALDGPMQAEETNMAFQVISSSSVAPRHTPSHSLSVSVETEEAADEFHDARSDEGGNGSSEDAKLPTSSQSKRNSASTAKQRRLRQKSAEPGTQSGAPETVSSGRQMALANARQLARQRELCDSSASDADAADGPLLVSPPQTRSRRRSARMEKIPSKSHRVLESVVLQEVADNDGQKPRAIFDGQVEKEEKVKQADEQYALNSTETMANATVQGLSIAPVGQTKHSDQKKSHQPALPHEMPSPNSVPAIAFGGEAPSEQLPDKSSIDRAGKSLPLPPLPSPPADIETPNLHLASHRSQPRLNGGKKSGIFSRIRRDKTPSNPQLRPSESFATSFASSIRSDSQNNIPNSVSNDSQWGDQSATGSVGLGIENALMRDRSDMTGESLRRPSHDGGWRARLPSFSASRASKQHHGTWQAHLLQSPPLPPVPGTSDESPRRGALQEDQSYSFLEAPSSNDSPRKATALRTPSSPPNASTIHKSLSPALLTEVRHEADEVGSFIGSDEAEGDRDGHGKRETWASFQSSELPLHKPREGSEIGGKPTTPRIDVHVVSEEDNGNHLASPAEIFSSNVASKPLSMTARRISRSQSNPKLASVPKALDLSSPVRSVSGQEKGRASFSVHRSPSSQIEFPGSPSNEIPSPKVEKSRQRNHSIGNVLFSGVAKPRSSFAADRDRSPVVNQIWADLPASPSPASPAVRKFFTTGKNAMRSKQRTTSNGALLLSEFDDSRASTTAVPSPSPGQQQGNMKAAFDAGSPPRYERPIEGRGTPSLHTVASRAFPESISTASASSSQPFSSHDHHSSRSLHSDKAGHARTVSDVDQHQQHGGAGGGALSGMPEQKDFSLGSHSTAGGESISSMATTMTDAGGSASINHSVSSAVKSINSSTPPPPFSLDRNGGVLTSSSGSSLTTVHSNAAEREAFDRMLRTRAKEDAERIREIAHRTASATESPMTPVQATSPESPA